MVPLQPLIALGCKLSILSLANLIDGLPEVLGDVELVEHDLGIRIRNVRARGADVGRPHVHCDVIKLRAAPGPQTLEIGLQNLLLAVVGHVNHDFRVDVVNHRHVLVPLLERGLIHTDLGRRL